MVEKEQSISQWPWTESSRPAAHPKEKWLRFVIGRFESNDCLSDDIYYQTPITDSVTVEELLGALEFARFLMTKCSVCREPAYIIGWNEFNYRPDGGAICWDCDKYPRSRQTVYEEDLEDG